MAGGRGKQLAMQQGHYELVLMIIYIYMHKQRSGKTDNKVFTVILPRWWEEKWFCFPIFAYLCVPTFYDVHIQLWR